METIAKVTPCSIITAPCIFKKVTSIKGFTKKKIYCVIMPYVIIKFSFMQNFFNQYLLKSVDKTKNQKAIKEKLINRV